MKTLSIRQPWAWLIVNGYKDIENRTWGTQVRGRVMVHAGQRIDSDAHWRLKETRPDIPLPDEYDCGGIVGSVEITGICTESDSPWFSGPFGFTLASGKPCEFRPCKGRLRFWTV